MPVTDFEFREKYRYQNGFQSHLETEAVPGTLPIGQNSPQKPPHGLYAEKLSGTSFTTPRHENKQTWLYRIVPACSLSAFRQEEKSAHASSSGTAGPLQFLPDQFRWDPFPDPDGATDFVDGLRQVAGAGDPTLKQGIGIFVYAANRSMQEQEAFYSSDGDLLIVPQDGVLDIRTELGWLLVRPMEICVIPRGIRYQVHIRGRGSRNETDGADGADGTHVARGYALELYQGHFMLPELGPIGSNGLANARDFQVPVASFDDGDNDGDGDGNGKGNSKSTAADRRRTYTVRTKMNQRLFRAEQDHTPFDVVGWQGTYYPYKYDLGRFNTIGSVSFDHPDPSIFTVLTAPSGTQTGTAVADFVIFPPRWLVGENTFRPPWYHRNTMSEYMGLLSGTYDAKRGGSGGFVPGGASLHNVMSGHGPDRASYLAARNEPQPQQPSKVGMGSCAFMFESCLMLGVTPWALEAKKSQAVTGETDQTAGPGQSGQSGQPGQSVLQKDYVVHSWGDLPRLWQRPAGAKANGHVLGGM